MRGQGRKSPALFVFGVTLARGASFLIGQSITIEEVRSCGITLANSPAASFFYLFTFLHAFLIACGWLALASTVVQFARSSPQLRRSTLDAVAWLWYFLGGLSVYLLLLTRLKIA
jgi:heme/copper-type cytochrome/quinol oxidase subunit 3